MSLLAVTLSTHMKVCNLFVLISIDASYILVDVLRLQFAT